MALATGFAAEEVRHGQEGIGDGKRGGEVHETYTGPLDSDRVLCHDCQCTQGAGETVKLPTRPEVVSKRIIDRTGHL